MFRTKFFYLCASFFVFFKAIFGVQYLSASEADFLYGGQFNSSFSNIRGDRTSSSMVSGYGWVIVKKPYPNGGSLNWESGISFERSDDGRVLPNQSFLEYDYQGKIKLSLGRMLEAAGRLHHDLIDYGAPAVGDNVPTRFFSSGSYPINVAEQLSQPFSNRVALYAKPIDNIALGVSYTPYSPRNNPLGYHYYTDTDVHNSVSLGGVTEFEVDNFFIGTTAGYTLARFDDTHLNISGAVFANQYSLYVREAIGLKNYDMYEMGYGCLRGDFLEQDCRAGWQRSWIRDDFVYSLGFKRRLFEDKLYAYDDYSLGYMYYLSPHTRIGFEHILRVKRSYENVLDGEHQWNFGFSQDF